MKDLKKMDIRELEDVLKEYPWFSIARKEMFNRMCKMGEEYRKDAIKKTVVYAFAGAIVSNKCLKTENKDKKESLASIDLEKDDFKKDDFKKSIPLDDDKEDKEDIKRTFSEDKKIYIVGGDYFSNKDFEDLKKKGNSISEVVNKRNFHESNAAPYITDVSEFEDQSYYTETLAKIYAEQELYAKSIAIYEKLILQYPKKSVYFASLIDELMKHI